MSDRKPPPVAVTRQCPGCHLPQTKIRRVLSDGRYGSMNYVCSRRECALGLDLSKLVTWVAV